MKTKLLILLVLGALVGCQKEPVSVSKTDNPEFNVSLLFEHDGIKVYRFHDVGIHYFTKYSVSCRHSCGKNCSYEHEIGVQFDTVLVPRKKP